MHVRMETHLCSRVHDYCCVVLVFVLFVCVCSHWWPTPWKYIKMCTGICMQPASHAILHSRSRACSGLDVVPLRSLLGLMRMV